MSTPTRSGKSAPEWQPQIILRRRLILVDLLLLIFIGFIISKLHSISFNTAIAEEAKSQRDRPVILSAARGDILDRDGAVLATSINCDTIVVAPPLLAEEDIELIATRLAPILEMDAAEIAEILTLPCGQTNLKRLLEPEVSARVMTVVKELEIEGINILKEPKRYYPWGSFAANVLGITGTENTGLEGIEKQYDLQLSGMNGVLQQEKDAAGRGIPYLAPESYNRPKDGYHLVLTIDKWIQSMLERVLEQCCRENLADAGGAIVLDPYTGEILGMASFPSFDPNHYDDYPSSWRINKMVREAFEPGSTFKIITALAALHEGVTYEDEYWEDTGILVAGGETFTNWDGLWNHGLLTFRQAMQNSSNVVLGQVGQRLGPETLVNYHLTMGFGALTGIDHPYEAEGMIFDAAYMGPTELVTAAFGQGPAVTPLQQVAAIAAIANGGNLMTPHLAKELLESDRTSRVAVEPEVIRQVATPQMMERMRNLMEFIINAPGSKGASPEYRLAGKTGTANKKDPEGRGYLADQYIASTIGFAPAENPLYVIYIYVDNPKGANGFYGGQVAAPFFREIAEELLRRDSRAARITESLLPLPRGIYEREVPYLRGGKVATALTALEELQVVTLLVGEGEDVVAQYPTPDSAGGTVSSIGRRVTLYLGD
ncbi:MAG: penicillin-binding transpeptidase domain-containing protein, partial [Symbiobacteriaceae bacterium]|nr:penicillin-binding transpeptidase domain-containing protein [Symbiobacteriaceae bacterium]